MTLTEFFEDKPRGAKIALARKLGELYTKGQVKRTTLRPDIFGDLK